MDDRFGPLKHVSWSRDRLYRALGLRSTSVLSIIPENRDRIVDTQELADEPVLREGGGVVCDGLITPDFGRGLALFPADCIPMVVYSSEVSVMGLFHVGKSGAELGIHTQGIERIVNDYEVALDDVKVIFGPSIQQASYAYPELSNELANDERWQPHMETRDGVHYLDLPGFAERGLLEMGLSDSQINRTQEDTGAREPGKRPRYFSHHRSDLTGEIEGRNGFVAVMRKN